MLLFFFALAKADWIGDVLFFGASQVFGYSKDCLSMDDAYHATPFGKYTLWMNATIDGLTGDCLALSGCRPDKEVNGFLPRLQHSVLSDFDYVVVMGGTNDLTRLCLGKDDRYMSHFLNTLISIHELVSSKSTLVYMLPFQSPILRDPECAIMYNKLRLQLLQLQESYKFIFKDANELLPSDKSPDYFNLYWDKVHLTLDGNKLLGESFSHWLKRYVNKSQNILNKA
jgi:lysophospholipase L1-like esterase